MQEERLVSSTFKNKELGTKTCTYICMHSPCSWHAGYNKRYGGTEEGRKGKLGQAQLVLRPSTNNIGDRLHMFKKA